MVAVCKAALLTALIYGSESWVLYRDVTFENWSSFIFVCKQIFANICYVLRGKLIGFLKVLND